MPDYSRVLAARERFYRTQQRCALITALALILLVLKPIAIPLIAYALEAIRRLYRLTCGFHPKNSRSTSSRGGSSPGS